LAVNHLHWLDSPVMLTVLPCPTRVFAGEKWANRLLIGFLLRSVNAIFVNRGEVDRKALREALATIKAGGSSGWLPKERAARPAVCSAAAVAPPTWPTTQVPGWCRRSVRTGACGLFSAASAPGAVRVVFGPPFEPPPVEGKVTRHLDGFTEEIMHRLAALLPPEYRGVYADVSVVNHSNPGLMGRDHQGA